jgi:hypothetical protein
MNYRIHNYIVEFIPIPSDLWTNEDDAIFLSYCPSKRIKCYHAVSRDTSCRPHEILKLKVYLVKRFLQVLCHQTKIWKPKLHD